VEQLLLRVEADRAAVVLARAPLEVAVDHVHQLERRVQAARGPGGDGVGKSGLVHAGEHFPV